MKKIVSQNFFIFFRRFRVDTANKHSFAIISANFRKNLKRSQRDTQRPGPGTLIYEKNLKISCQTPFKHN
jgi:hypothetical protein